MLGSETETSPNNGRVHRGNTVDGMAKTQTYRTIRNVAGNKPVLLLMCVEELQAWPLEEASESGVQTKRVTKKTVAETHR